MLTILSSLLCGSSRGCVSIVDFDENVCEGAAHRTIEASRKKWAFLLYIIWTVVCYWIVNSILAIKYIRNRNV